ncbi:MAG TPA: alpha/beta fold hydrolase [Acidimicrobiia bacterium]|nr:alpha/beta fold hydrolase [Acidimicrobiia bacterium]
MPPLDASLIARSAVVADPRWSPDGRWLGWVEGIDGRAELMLVPVDGSAPRRAITTDGGVTPTRATGGGAWCWVGAEQVAVVGADGSLRLVGIDGRPHRTLVGEGRASAPAPDLEGSRIAFVLETDETCDIAIVGTDGGRPPAVVSHADFAWDPAWSPDGSRLAWHEWDLAAMSWDASRLVVADGHGASPVVVAGGSDEAVGQPRFSPDGSSLAFVRDRGGWCNVWVAAADGARPRPLVTEEHEHAEPAWGVGQRSFAWSPDGAAIAFVRNERGFARLVVADVATGRLTDLARGWHHGLDWGAGGIVAIRSGARTPPTVTVHDSLGGAAPDAGRRTVARGAPAGIEDDFVEPEPVDWSGDDGTPRFGLLFRPAPGPDRHEVPPLLVDVHGGPTGQSTVQWRPWVQYFVSRGWAVLAPDFRGSTGHGREYTQELTGGWGVLDVADVAHAITVAADRGWGDPTRVAAAGSSAGGLTVLLVAARHPHLVRAVVSSYGVTDLAALATTTHRFESRYLDRIVGPLPAEATRYRERSPVACAGGIRVPTLVLQGDADKVVPAEQARALVDAIRDAGGTVELEVYRGEGHGWAAESTIVDVYARTDRFLTRHVLDRAPGREPDRDREPTQR